jgi:UPF0042 nucleotide-binding protein
VAQDHHKAKPSIAIITGLSGSGKSVALRALEDIGFFCVDNLPPQLIDSFASTIAEKVSRIAIGIDIRERDFLPVVDSVIKGLRKKYSITIIFLEAENDVLMRRFKETRRPHPLTGQEKDIQQAISTERDLLQPLRDNADRIIDTSSFTPHQLRHHMTSLYAHEAARDSMSLTLISFGYKFGVPQNIDLLFDVRFIPNPHFVPELKDLRGTDAPVREFVLEKPEAGEFVKKLVDLLNFLIPLYRSEGKASLHIGIGCTGGRHRSPAILEKVASLIEQDYLDITTVHRDM